MPANNIQPPMSEQTTNYWAKLQSILAAQTLGNWTVKSGGRPT